MSLQDSLTRFINDNLIRDAAVPLTPDTSLIDLGLVDSIGLMQILGFVENEASVRVPDHMVTPDHFESIAAIARMVEDLRKPA
jgi:acyl carrier protein